MRKGVITMNEKTLGFNYRSYIKVLQDLYGDVTLPYFDENYNYLTESHTDKFGHQLGKHHIFEDTADSLSTVETAKLYPFEWQQPESLVWCSPNQHCMLHYMIFRESDGVRSTHCLDSWFKHDLKYAVEHNCIGNLRMYYYICQDLVNNHSNLLRFFSANVINCFKDIAALDEFNIIVDVDAIKSIGLKYFSL